MKRSLLADWFLLVRRSAQREGGLATTIVAPVTAEDFNNDMRGTFVHLPQPQRHHYD